MGITSSTPVALHDVNSHYGKQDGHIAALSMSFKVDNSNENSTVHIIVNVIENDRPHRKPQISYDRVTVIFTYVSARYRARKNYDAPVAI